MARRLVLEAEPIAGCEVLLDVRLWVADRVGVQRTVEGITELAVVAAQDRVEVGNDAVRCKGDLLLLSQGRIVFVFKDGAGVLKLRSSDSSAGATSSTVPVRNKPAFGVKN